MKKEDNKNMKIEKMSKAELIERIEKLSALLKNSGWKKQQTSFRLGVWVVADLFRLLLAAGERSPTQTH